ncbi:hypothetical protein [Sulfitobacter mediterraneus]|uniref:Uncharacterized protein n=1 Tax=Sulfitobacter mediterraneus TaxID=83219 RepID=A0A2T6C525_9RHOB|nr:hypothetical protein [Sulfitobacter mediterraneus]KIN78173.1 hypothetical protein Z950_4013 [Sulfitobacter mediterraneus KCTC 32188]PTX63383.1 hypothetical protein C8N31_11717 [Sulfitobacter mediterraneus]
MTETSPPNPTETTSDVNAKNVIASRFFWATVALLAVATLALTVASSFQTTNSSPQHSVEIEPTTLARILSDTAISAQKAVAPDIDAHLDAVYAPAYAAIPAYADFHYSVLGEYIELTAAATGQMSDAIHERLFDGFENRLTEAAAKLNKRYVEEYQRILEKQVAQQVSPGGATPLLGEVTDAVLQDAISRAHTTLPLATVAAGIVGSGSLKLVSATIAKKLAAKVAAKASAKGLAKGGGVIAGAGGGALLCSWSGPGAAVCGVVGGAAAWLLTDAVVVNIDEYFNREDFEDELRKMLVEDRAEKREQLTAALRDKAVAMDAAVEEIFKMRDLHKAD